MPLLPLQPTGVPGSNLLDDATTVINTAIVDYMPYVSRAKNSVGQYVTTYGASVPVEASVQAVPRSVYQQLGLDLQKQYISVFASLQVTDLDRDVTGDRFVLPDGRLYQIQSQTDWFGIDGGWQGGVGWVGPVLCVKVDYKV